MNEGGTGGGGIDRAEIPGSLSRVHISAPLSRNSGGQECGEKVYTTVLVATTSHAGILV
jgi:hypothetical protein